MSQTAKGTIGWREWVSLPDLHIAHIKVKVDSGARSCALHAEDITLIRRRRKRFVKFTVMPYQRNRHYAIHAKAPLAEVRRVRSSNGEIEERYTITTTLCMDGHTWPIDITLTNRDVMGFRMLLGRQAVRGHHLIDVGRAFVLGQPHKTKRSRPK